MANKPLDTEFVDRAIRFAVDAHAGTERRGKGFPYVIHVLEAMSIVATITPDPELLAAAALHDTVEDTDVTPDRIRAEFGDRVARLVAAETEPEPEGVSWRERKQHAIDRLAAASRDAKIVAMGDKLSNMRAIANDWLHQGDRLWSIFHAPGGKPDHEWHYRGLAESLSDLAGTDAYTEFVTLIEKVFGDPKPELIDLADYAVSGDGYTAVSYDHKDGDRMMKLYADFIHPSVPLKELKTCWAVRDLGLLTPNAYRLVTDGKRIGVEFERVAPKKSFARAISQDPSSLKRLAADFARMCLDLHSKPCHGDFPSASLHFKEVVNASKDFTEAQKARMIDFINAVPAADTCLHGDLHIGNAIINTDTGVEYWIDLSDFSYGNPDFDLGMFYLACNCNPEELTMHLYHVDNATMRAVWQEFVSVYFGPDADIAAVDAHLAPFAALYLVFFGQRSGMDEGMKKFVIDNLCGE